MRLADLTSGIGDLAGGIGVRLRDAARTGLSRTPGPMRPRPTPRPPGSRRPGPGVDAGARCWRRWP
ncbi:hypothetical protein V2I01_21095 [Micromonospora sp. BRA006-A]|nr:hypothetical protein [Micromonospora sp. BRA006-A]